MWVNSQACQVKKKQTPNGVPYTILSGQTIYIKGILCHTVIYLFSFFNGSTVDTQHYTSLGVQRSDRTSVHITLCSPREAPVGHGTAPWQHHALYSPCRVFNYFLIYLVRNLAVVFCYYTSILDIYPSPLLRDFSVALSLRRRISRSKRKHIQTLIDSDKLPKRLFWCLNSINRRSRLNHTHLCLGKIFILSHTLSNFFLFCFLGFFLFFF